MEKLQLDISEFEFVNDEDEAFASVSLNPTFRWMKFILTDDKPNLNLRRIPQEEFDNLIRTGIFAPIKMSEGGIADHPTAFPIGTITALKKEGNQIKGLAALWSEERPEDVQMIKDRYDRKEPLNLSWEILHSGYEEEEGGVKALKNTALRATTFVSLPAYAGRTTALEVSSTNNGTEDAELEELEQAKLKITELETAISEKDSTIASLNGELETLKTQNTELSNFKAEIEKEVAELEKLDAIKVKFSEAGITKEDQYFVDNRERLLSLDESALDFMVQEFVAFASKTEKKTEKSSVEIPDLSTSHDTLSAKELGKKLRESRK